MSLFAVFWESHQAWCHSLSRTPAHYCACAHTRVYDGARARVCMTWSQSARAADMNFGVSTSESCLPVTVPCSLAVSFVQVDAQRRSLIASTSNGHQSIWVKASMRHPNFSLGASSVEVRAHSSPSVLAIRCGAPQANSQLRSDSDSSSILPRTATGIHWHAHGYRGAASCIFMRCQWCCNCTMVHAALELLL